MTTNAIAPATTNAAAGLRSSGNAGRFGDLKSEDFFKILISELRQQDPFEPAKTQDMISQVSQIRGIELSGALTNTLQKLTQQQQAAGAGDLLGKHVTALLVGADGTPQRIEGVVTGVQFDSDGSALLELDTGTNVPLAHVTEVMTVEEAERRKNPSAGGSPATSAAAAGATPAATTGGAANTAPAGTTTGGTATATPSTGSNAAINPAAASLRHGAAGGTTAKPHGPKWLAKLGSLLDL